MLREALQSDLRGLSVFFRVAIGVTQNRAKYDTLGAILLAKQWRLVVPSCFLPAMVQSGVLFGSVCAQPQKASFLCMNRCTLFCLCIHSYSAHTIVCLV